KYHYGFGYKLMLSGSLDTAYRNVYNVIIGRYFSVQELGYFERGNAFNTYPVTILTRIISKVSYTLLSKIKNQKERIAKVYSKLIQLDIFVTAPMLVCAAASFKPLFVLVLGDEWLPAVPFFKILCLTGMFDPIHPSNLNVLKGYGRSDRFLI